MTTSKLYDITEVCQLLGTTSRTLRFYEEKRLITSTTIGTSTRRQYTPEQLNHIRNVLVLRTLGLSIKSITQLQQEHCDLKDAILSKRMEIYASIQAKRKEIHLLNEALILLEDNKNIFNYNWNHHLPSNTSDCDSIAKKCTDCIIYGNHDALYAHFSDKLKTYLPLDAYKQVYTDTLIPLGNFTAIEKTELASQNPNVIFYYLRYEHAGLRIQYIFHNNQIHGLWFRYYELTQI